MFKVHKGMTIKLDLLILWKKLKICVSNELSKL